MPVFDKLAEKLRLKSPASEEDCPKPDIDAKKEPALDNSKITVIFVLGGPGAGMSLRIPHLQVCGSLLGCRKGNTVHEAR